MVNTRSNRFTKAINGEIASIEATIQTYYAEYGHDPSQYSATVRNEYCTLRNRLSEMHEINAVPKDHWLWDASE